MGRAAPQNCFDRAKALILVVDDNTTGRALFRRLLSRRGYAVTGAASGASAIGAISRQMPDLVLLDLRLPDIDGAEVLRHVRAEYDMNELPIIMISAEHDGEVAAACLQLGANDFLMKPTFSKALYESIAACLAPRFPVAGAVAPALHNAASDVRPG